MSGQKQKVKRGSMRKAHQLKMTRLPSGWLSICGEITGTFRSAPTVLVW